MKWPLLSKSGHSERRAGERGVTIALVALAIVAIMAIAALSVDVVTLYMANAEAQRSADAAALSAARVLSILGVTGDPANSGNVWKPACALATQVATAVATQNGIGGSALTSVTVTFPNNSDSSTCTGTDAAFGVNPLVTVKVQRTDMPTFFARIWGRTGATVGATATAEAYNSSNSATVNAGHRIIPVQPRCVKPWIVPNLDPGNAGTCGAGSCASFVETDDGSITSRGIRVGGAGTGVIGRTFNLFAGCNSAAEPCDPKAVSPNTGAASTKPNVVYYPGQVPSASTAVPSCATATPYEEAVGGCDQTTVYQCGVPRGSTANPNTIDLAENPIGATGDTAVAVQCLAHQNTIDEIDGQDTLDTSSYPYKSKSGTASSLGLAGNSVITSSNSVVSFPIYDSENETINATGTTPVTIVGFLQVFINQVNANGSVNVTVLNVTGCSNGQNGTVGNPVFGSSPVPVRLIKYP